MKSEKEEGPAFYSCLALNEGLELPFKRFFAIGIISERVVVGIVRIYENKTRKNAVRENASDDDIVCALMYMDPATKSRVKGIFSKHLLSAVGYTLRKKDGATPSEAVRFFKGSTAEFKDVCRDLRKEGLVLLNYRSIKPFMQGIDVDEIEKEG